ncbi:MAG: Tex family protein [Oscillospiraceae bacterium]
MDIIKQLAEELKLKESQVKATVELIDGGNTIPFIARYRKEATGSLDDNILRDLFDRLTYIRNLEKRKTEVTTAIETLELLTDELREEISNSATLTEVEDIYRPFKPKRRTRASIAKEKGLEPLATSIFQQEENAPEAIIMAEAYVNEEKGVLTAEDALKGAVDIIAETISDDAAIRRELRSYIMRYGTITSKGKTEDESVYSMYYDFSDTVSKVAGHRILAMDRGEREGILKVSINTDVDIAHKTLERHTITNPSSNSAQVVREAGIDAFERLIYPSIENEVRNFLTEQAAELAIKLFATNLHQLLMQPPVKGNVALGLDPAYRTGCKIAVVDHTGKVLDTTVIYPTPPQSKVEEASKTIKNLIMKYGVSIIAIGNGTASKESEIFVANLIKELDCKVAYMVVSESGASVYSASKLAAEEFPQYDVSLRSAVSIARRLQDPLAELVKIDPKAIGVGQYQHDMPKNRLDTALSGVVESCVNTVGVDVNTASHSLLSHVAGIGPALAKNIIVYREENGEFKERKQLLKVAKLGKKAYEQCAGFLRIPESKNVLDNTAVHPESYSGAMKLLSLLNYTEKEISQGDFADLKQRAEGIGLDSLSEQIGIGKPTLLDIIDEMLRPGRDPRESLPPPMLRTDLLDMKDLKPDMILDGTVRNVIDFGAFVDIGVHQDGLVHISNITEKFINHPSEVLKVGDIVKVKVLEVDVGRKRIGLTMKGI